MKNFFRGIVFAIVALVLGGWLYLRFGFADVCANIPLSWLDSEVASTAIHASAARHAPEAEKPDPADRCQSTRRCAPLPRQVRRLPRQT